MKKDYKIGEDIFVCGGIFFLAVSIIIKMTSGPLMIGTALIMPRSLFNLSVGCLLISIALNLQDMASKN